MKNKSILFAIITFLIFNGCCWYFDPKLYEANVDFVKKVVSFRHTHNVGLRALFGNTENEIANQIQASHVSLTVKGIFMLLFLNIGIAVLVFLRVYYDGKRKEITASEK